MSRSVYTGRQPGEVCVNSEECRTGTACETPGGSPAQGLCSKCRPVELHTYLCSGLFFSHSTLHLWLTSPTNTSFTTSMPTTLNHRAVTFPENVPSLLKRRDKTEVMFVGTKQKISAVPADSIQLGEHSISLCLSGRIRCSLGTLSP